MQEHVTIDDPELTDAELDAELRGRIRVCGASACAFTRGQEVDSLDTE